MAEILLPIESTDLTDLFPKASEDLLHLFASAAENADLVQADFQTIRDLVELADYDGPETLHVLLLDLLLAREEGSLCVEASVPGLARRLADLVGESMAKTWAERIVADLDSSRFSGVIGLGAGESMPVILHSSGGRRFLYFQKFLHHDLIFQEALGERFSPTTGINPAARLFDQAVKEVLEKRPLHIDGQALQLDDGQKCALKLALERDFAVISGGPGTGKTSIVLTLLRCLVRCGYSQERIALAAPTGRAAQRLGEAIRAGLANLDDTETSADTALTDLAPQTLHQLLRYNPERGGFGRHVENPIPADAVIVDEVSMVGLELMSHLLQALSPKTKLVLLGDKDQLPSVDAGAVLANLVSVEERDSVVVLENNYRSQAHIQEVARAINRQDAGIVERMPTVNLSRNEAGYFLTASLCELESRGGCYFLPQSQGSVGELRHILQEWARYQYFQGTGGLPSFQDLVAQCGSLPISENMPPEQKDLFDQLFRVLNRGRLLTLVREGPWGCVDINSFFEEQLRPRWDRTGRALFAGAPVLITRNDHPRQLFNGDVGVTLKSPGGGLRVLFPRPEGYAVFAPEALPAHELGFALTVHKSQGSEYGQVLLILPPEGGRRLLTKEILYTGITRAKQLAVVCASREVVQYAIARKIERESAWQMGALGNVR
jgi:exodeoxyribonuclease V alpha subunit